MSTVTEDAWDGLMKRLGVAGERAGALWQGLTAAYDEPHRHYHSLRHIDALVTAFTPLKDRFDDADAALLALFYHDIVYDPARPDNEERSADRLRDDLLNLISGETIKRACWHVWATKAHNADADPDTNLALDLDMGILGALWPAYLAYAEGVFREYAPVYGREAYARGRTALFLEPTLAKPHIFLTAEFAQREEQARQNLARELELWAGGGFA